MDGSWVDKVPLETAASAWGICAEGIEAYLVLVVR